MTDAPAAPTPRGTRNPLMTIRRIVDAARVEFGNHGFDGTKVEHIARRAKVSKQLVYFYFKGKDEIYWELLKDISIRTNERLLAIDYDALPPDVAIRRYVETIYDIFAEDPLIGMVSLDQSLHGGAQLRSISEIRQQQKLLVDKLSSVVQRGRAQGVFNDDVTDHKIEFMAVILTVGCQSSSTMLERYSGRSWQENPEQTREFAIDFIMRALRP